MGNRSTEVCYVFTFKYQQNQTVERELIVCEEKPVNESVQQNILNHFVCWDVCCGLKLDKLRNIPWKVLCF